MSTRNWIRTATKMPEIDIPMLIDNGGRVVVKQSKSVLVTIQDENGYKYVTTDFAYAAEDGKTYWNYGRHIDGWVIAWKPMPEPYGGYYVNKMGIEHR